jgi:hypothetical protein
VIAVEQIHTDRRANFKGGNRKYHCGTIMVLGGAGGGADETLVLAAASAGQQRRPRPVEPVAGMDG